MPRFTPAFKDALNPGILDDIGNPVPTPHGIYVDDDIYLDVADPRRFEQAIAASIEAIFILLGNPTRPSDRTPSLGTNYTNYSWPQPTGSWGSSWICAD